MRYCDWWLHTMKFGDGRRNRLLRGALLVVILLGIVFVVQVMDYRVTIEKHNEMAIEMETYSKLAAKVNDSSCCAVQSEQVPMVLGDIIQKGKDFGLVVKAGEKPLYQDDTASIYEIHLKGSWKRTAMYLENMQAKDALLCGGQSSSCNADDFSVAEAKPLWQNNPAQVVELADYSPFASEKSVQGKTVAGAEEKRKIINIPEKRQMIMARVYPTIPQIPTRHNTVNNRPEQNASPKHSEPEKNHYSSKIAFIGGEGIEIKNSQGE